MLERIRYYFSKQRTLDCFTTYLMQHINLKMIEYTRGKKIKNIEKDEEWQKLLFSLVEELLPKFTYRQWKVILSTDEFYTISSKNKNEDIQNNLYHFLECHYLELYQLFDMKTYAQYQKRNSKELWKLVFVQDAYQNGKKRSALFMIYQDESRIGYDVSTKERVMMELLEIMDDTLVITLVYRGQLERKTFFDWLLNLF